MKANFTLRDYLTYTFIGFFFCGCSFIHFSELIFSFIEKTKDYSGLIIFLLIPLSYFMGHFALAIDDMLYNNWITRQIFKSMSGSKCTIVESIAKLLFANRSRYVVVLMNKSFIRESFEEMRMNLVLKGAYEKADYYQIMSDLFKGLFVIMLLNIIYSLFAYPFSCMRLLTQIGLLLIIWFRSRTFVTYYVNFIINSSKQYK